MGRFLNKLLGRVTYAQAAELLRAQAWVVAFQSTNTTAEAVERTTSSTVSDDVKMQILIDYLLLYVHMINRVALSTLGPERHRRLMVFFENEVSAAMATALFPNVTEPGKMELVHDKMVDMIREFASTFEHYTMTPKDHPGLKGTILWEFSKHVTRSAGLAPENVVALNATVAPAIVSGFQVINPRKTLEKIS